MAKSKHGKPATQRLKTNKTARQEISPECIKLVMDRNKQSGTDNWKTLQKVTIEHKYQQLSNNLATT